MALGGGKFPRIHSVAQSAIVYLKLFGDLGYRVIGFEHALDYFSFERR